MGVKLDMIGLVVKDIDASLEFYRRLGMDVPTEYEGPYVETTLPGGIRISWNSVAMMKEIDPHWVEPVGHRMGFAYLCDSAAEVDERYRSLVGNGYASHKEPWDAFWGQRYAQVVDPDGNIVDLFAPLEG